ncbi:DUF4160 domain-containing protein [Nibricoccus sp. IMCC34717]|uniref:DUF4160 domain-containing protein n=1 Tax=Nibricoccus sp. IMCC34717 TaxID=3034021 RepID=UPI00384E5C33
MKWAWPASQCARAGAVKAISSAIDPDLVALNIVRVPSIFEREGFRFFFYSNDHAPAHVHVRKGSGEAVFVLAPEVLLQRSEGLTPQELSKAHRLTKENRDLIIRAWYEFFDPSL